MGTLISHAEPTAREREIEIVRLSSTEIINQPKVRRLVNSDTTKVGSPGMHEEIWMLSPHGLTALSRMNAIRIDRHLTR